MGGELSAEIHDAIAEAIRTHEGAMVGPWVLAAQTTDADGKREVWVLSAPETAIYEAKGLLAEATDRIRDEGAQYAWTSDDDTEDES